MGDGSTLTLEEMRCGKEGMFEQELRSIKLAYRVPFYDDDFDEATERLQESSSCTQQVDTEREEVLGAGFEAEDDLQKDKRTQTRLLSNEVPNAPAVCKSLGTQRLHKRCL